MPGGTTVVVWEKQTKNMKLKKWKPLRDAAAAGERNAEMIWQQFFSPAEKNYLFHTLRLTCRPAGRVSWPEDDPFALTRERSRPVP